MPAQAKYVLENAINGSCMIQKPKKSMEVYMFGFGVPELLIVLAIVLVIFGAGKLPEIGSAFGKGIRNFKKSSEGKDEIEIN
jgi:sec-independent protein translocase protein TatA